MRFQIETEYERTAPFATCLTKVRILFDDGRERQLFEAFGAPPLTRPTIRETFNDLEREALLSDDELVQLIEGQAIERRTGDVRSADRYIGFLKQALGDLGPYYERARNFHHLQIVPVILVTER